MGDWIWYVVAGLLGTFVVAPVLAYVFLLWFFKDLWR